MRFSELPIFGSNRLIEVRLDQPSGNTPFRKDEEVRLIERDGDFSLLHTATGQAFRIEATDSTSRNALLDFLLHDLPRLTWIETVSFPQANTAPLLRIASRRFSTHHLQEHPLRIHIDQKILDAVEKKVRLPINLAQAASWLTEEFLLPAATSGGKTRAVFRPGADEASPFLLIGNNSRMVVALRPGGGWRAERLISSPGEEPEDARWLVEGEIQFGDFPEGQDKSAIRELERLRQSNAGYLALWRTYEKMEWQTLHQRAREFGLYVATSAKRLANGNWELILEPAPTPEQAAVARHGDEGLAMARRAPDYLTLPEPPSSGGRSPSFSPEFSGTCVSIQGNRLVLEPSQHSADKNPPTHGAVFLDLTGTAVAIQRRSAARQRIDANREGIPLAAWIEGHPLTSRPGHRHEPLSPAVRKLFAPFQPTARQIEALDIALNTPDIALIQGPPGTGKTRVIAALLTRLAEISEKEERSYDKNLLTSFQHDAVENAVAISGVNGLPPIKYGRKKGGQVLDIGIDKWRHEHLQKLDDALAHRSTKPLQLQLENLRKRRIAYLKTPGSEAGTAKLLDDAVKNARDLLSLPLIEKFRALISRLSRGENDAPEIELLKTAVHGLRTSEAAFSDDGPRAAHRLRTRLDAANRLDASTRALLDRASAWVEGEALDFLSALEEVNSRLLDDLTPPLTARRGATRINTDVAALLDEAEREAEARVAASPSDGIDLAIERLRHDLSYDSDLKEALGRYTVVLAATCQQAVSEPLREQLASGDKFAAVIVDEAARANPLDLLIPLSRARRRIILVGDHRQLPHMLEPDIERELNKTLDEETKAAMGQSLFHRLFEQAKKQQGRGDIKRWVTLNAQYRMHPALGRFVSRVFYERHGEDEKFDSPGAPESYQHPLTGSLAGKVAAWKDIPRTDGLEQRQGTSWQRRAEASWIAAEAERILNQHPGLSLGVISFYAAQVSCILREMLAGGLTEKSETGELKIANAYEKTTNKRGEPAERLRVGTVDAFQGKEFDVVILSFTRCNTHRVAAPEDLRRKFGHLLLENRLCVAMSRQRQLLIVCGDRAMLDAPALAETAPGLTEFMRLCQGPEGVVLK